MNKTRLIILVLIVLTIGLAVFSGTTYMETLSQENEITDLEKQLENLTEDHQELIENHRELNQTHQNLTKEHQELKTDYESLEIDYESLEIDYEELKEEYQYLKEEQAIGKTEYHSLAIQNDEGVVSEFTAKVIEGQGSIYIDIGKNLFTETTQKASQTSLEVANQHTDLDLKNEYSVLISWKTTADTIDGPSASAAETLAIISAATNQEINKDIAITGEINQDGSITQVGAIEEKTTAAKDQGYETVLVPPGQHIDIDGIEVIEVNDIHEAKTHLNLN